MNKAVIIGVLLLLLGFVFFVLTVVLIILALREKKRQRTAQTARAAVPVPQSAPTVPPPPPRPAPPAAPPREVVPVPEDDRTIVVSAALGTLHCIAGALLGQHFAIPVKGLTIGRQGGNADIIVPEGAVSKKHVWIGPRDGQLVAVDEGSTNGTFLRPDLQTRITTTPLKPGDALVLVSEAVAVFELRS
jgi:hypothetical protein